MRRVPSAAPQTEHYVKLVPNHPQMLKRWFNILGAHSLEPEHRSWSSLIIINTILNGHTLSSHTTTLWTHHCLRYVTRQGLILVLNILTQNVSPLPSWSPKKHLATTFHFIYLALTSPKYQSAPTNVASTAALFTWVQNTTRTVVSFFILNWTQHWFMCHKAAVFLLQKN